MASRLWIVRLAAEDNDQNRSYCRHQGKLTQLQLGGIIKLCAHRGGTHTFNTDYAAPTKFEKSFVTKP